MTYKIKCAVSGTLHFEMDADIPAGLDEDEAYYIASEQLTKFMASPNYGDPVTIDVARSQGRFAGKNGVCNVSFEPGGFEPPMVDGIENVYA